MSVSLVSPFRRGAFAFTTVAALAAASFSPAQGQTALNAGPPAATTKVSKVDCAIFASYVLDEAKLYKEKMSKTFLQSVARFLGADCAATDKDGPVQIITMTDQDAASLRTALRLMGRVDIIGLSGVGGCHSAERRVPDPRRVKSPSHRRLVKLQGSSPSRERLGAVPAFLLFGGQC